MSIGREERTWQDEREGIDPLDPRQDGLDRSDADRDGWQVGTVTSDTDDSVTDDSVTDDSVTGGEGPDKADEAAPDERGPDAGDADERDLEERRADEFRRDDDDTIVSDSFATGSSQYGADSGTDSRFDSGADSGFDSSVGSSVDSGRAAAQNEWQSLQGRFVDDPDSAVREAAALVDGALQQLVGSLQAGSGEASEVSTEQKRQAFQRYRAVHEALTRA